jgi:hypothetical protein
MYWATASATACMQALPVRTSSAVMHNKHIAACTCIMALSWSCSLLIFHTQQLGCPQIRECEWVTACGSLASCSRHRLHMSLLPHQEQQDMAQRCHTAHRTQKPLHTHGGNTASPIAVLQNSSPLCCQCKCVPMLPASGDGRVSAAVCRHPGQHSPHLPPQYPAALLWSSAAAAECARPLNGSSAFIPCPGKAPTPAPATPIPAGPHPPTPRCCSSTRPTTPAKTQVPAASAAAAGCCLSAVSTPAQPQLSSVATQWFFTESIMASAR